MYKKKTLSFTDTSHTSTHILSSESQHTLLFPQLRKEIIIRHNLAHFPQAINCSAGQPCSVFELYPIIFSFCQALNKLRKTDMLAGYTAQL